MKRASTILLSFILLLLVSGCAKTYKDIKVTSFDLVSVTPQGLTRVDALIDVGIDNPIVGFEVFDANGLVKLDGEPCLSITADQLVVQGKTAKTYRIPLNGVIADGFNPFQLLTLFKNLDMSRVTVDLSARVNLRGGVGKVFEFKDMPLDKMLHGSNSDTE